MEGAEVIKQFFSRYYPRNHMMWAGGLFALLVFLLVLLPGDDGNRAIARTTTLKLEIPNTDTHAAILAASRKADTSPGVTAASSMNQSTKSLPAASSPKQPTPADDDDWKNMRVKPGDNLSALFYNVGLSDRDVYRLINSSEQAQVLNRLHPGYELSFKIAETGELEQLRVFKNPQEGYLFARNQGGYEVDSIFKEADIRQVFKVGTITDSLFMAGKREQIPALHTMQMANIFGGVIDLILDPRRGDTFSVLYEEKYLDGEFIGYGDLLATQYVNRGSVYTAVRYVDDEGESGYYNPNGESMRKAFLRNPLDVFRISSNFNPSRRHPILNTIRAHKGTDYAAPTGTPIRATSDGRVTWAARNGSFGNLVTIEHAGGFETKYAHLSRIARSVSKGSRVRQGDVIGYVGSTGSATGPHLHYEFLMDGVHQNPRTIHDRLPKAKSITASEFNRFKGQATVLLQQFNNLNNDWLLSQNQASAD